VSTSEDTSRLRRRNRRVATESAFSASVSLAAAAAAADCWGSWLRGEDQQVPQQRPGSRLTEEDARIGRL